MKKASNNSAAAILRQKAEDSLKKKPSKSGSQLSEGDMLKLIHELEVHQIELELQNEELLLAKSTALETAEKYTELYDFAPSGYFTVSKESKIIDLNLTGSKMLGKERSRLKNSTLNLFISDDTKQIYNLFVEKVFASKVRESCEVILSSDGNSPLYVRLYGIITEKGDRCLITMVDITERKQVEEEKNQLLLDLQKGKDALQGLIDGITDEIWFADDQKRFILANPSALHEFGLNYNADAIDIQKFAESLEVYRLDGSARPVEEAPPLRALKGEVVKNQEEMICTPATGEIRYRQVNSNPIRDASGQIIGSVSVVRDITARKLVEAERERLHQLLQDQNVELENAKSVAEKANLAKSDFLSSMSHELRSPLNAILGFAQLMESDSPPPTPSQKEGIDQILQAGWHLLKLINEILDLARIESGRLSLSSEPLSMAEIMIECQTMIESQAQNRGISMTFPPLDIPYFVHADRTRVKQVLINLLSNAIKYNKASGTVEVDCFANSASGRIRVSVSDTGEGLSPEKREKLFQPFNRLGQETGAEEGTGIGLVVAKQLTELMGGVIGVESTVGVGSTFWFELIADVAPRHTVGEVAPAAVVQHQLPNGARMRILLYVEDNPANLKLVEKLVARRSDLHLLTAVTGYHGIKLARASQPEMILMDINLPDLSGIEVMKILREDPATAHIPIVALSANAMPRDIEKGLAAGFFRYLTKPIKVDEFMETLEMVLEFVNNREQSTQMKQE